MLFVVLAGLPSVAPTCNLTAINTLANTNYQSTNTAAGCPLCSYGCSVCSQPTQCSSCLRSFYLSANICLKCPTPFCARCPSAVCSLCISGFYISGLLCLPCASNSICISSTSVQSCMPGFYVTQFSCASCSANCLTCNSTTCSLCAQGYIISGSVCQQCIPNCISCTSTTNCRTCASGFDLGSGQCTAISCVSNCAFCTNTATCVSCNPGWYLNSQRLCSIGGSLLCLISVGIGFSQCQSGTSYTRCSPFADQDTSLYLQAPNYCVSLAYTTRLNVEFFPLALTPPAGACMGFSPLTSPITFDISSAKRLPSFQIKVRLQLLLAGITNPSGLTVSLKLGSANPVLAPIPSSARVELCGASDNSDTIVMMSYDFATSSVSSADLISASPLLLTVSAGQGYSSAFLGETQVVMSLCSLQNCLICGSQYFCVECKPNYYLQLNSCLQSCSPGFFMQQQGTLWLCVISCSPGFFPNYGLLTCSLCANSCFTCSSENTCLTCPQAASGQAQTLFLFQTRCVSSCQSDSALYYADSALKQCLPCLNPCYECSQEDGASCVSCSSGYLSDTTCIYMCPDGKFGGTISGKHGLFCKSCTSPCLTCVISDTLCLTCVGSQVQLNFACQDNCPSSQYSSLGVCKSCISPCLTCTTSTACLACAFGYFSSGSCFALCPAGFFGKDNTCSSCPQGCSACQYQLCVACLSQYFLSKETCVQSQACPAGTFADTSSSKCADCQPPCQACSTSASACTDCTIGYLSNSKCFMSCPMGTFADSNDVCQTCNSKCSACFGLSTNCTSCSLANGYYMDTLCVQTCPPGKFTSGDSSGNGLCSLCLASCLTCSQTAANCKSCDSTLGLTLQVVNSFGSCQGSCSANQIKLSGKCQTCTQPCLSCSGTVTTCTKCIYGYKLLQNSCYLNCEGQGNYFNDEIGQLCLSSCSITGCAACLNTVWCKTCASGYSFYQNLCFLSCPANTISQNNVCRTCTDAGLINCFLCSGPSSCTQCVSGYSLTSLGSCLSSCPTQSFPTLQGTSQKSVCQSCQAPCYACTSFIQCLSCRTNTPPYYLFQTSGSCLTVCPDGFFSPTGSSTSSNTLSCAVCPAICLSCTSFANCLTCAPGYFYKSESKSCLQSCSSDFSVLDSFYDGLCKACQFPCKTCLLTVYNCKSCVQGYVFIKGCFPACPTGYFGTTVDSIKSCNKCADSCFTCEGSSSSCNSCKGSLYLTSGACSLACPSGFYPSASISGNVCQQCTPTCNTCSDSITCLSCPNTQLLKQGVCLAACGVGFFVQQRQCVTCSAYCIQCVSSNQCTQCSGAFLYEGKCALACPQQTFGDISTLACSACQSPCSNCRDLFICLSCVSGQLLFGQECFPMSLGCPADTWILMDSASCSQSCLPPLLQFAPRRECYSQCPYNLYRMGSSCLVSCPQSHYYSSNQECTACGQLNCQSSYPVFNLSAYVDRGQLVATLIFSAPFNVSTSSLAFGVQVQNITSTAPVLSRMLSTYISNVTVLQSSPRIVKLLLPGSSFYSSVRLSVSLLNRNQVQGVRAREQLQNYQAQTVAYVSTGFGQQDIAASGALRSVGIALSVIVLLLAAILMVLDRLHLMLHLLQLAQSAFLFNLLSLNGSPSIASFFQGLRYVHLWFINFSVVPQTEFSPGSSPNYYLYVTDGTFLRSVIMDFLVGALFCGLALAFWIVNRVVPRPQFALGSALLLKSSKQLDKKSKSKLVDKQKNQLPNYREKLIAVLTLRFYSLLPDGLQLVFVNLSLFSFCQAKNLAFSTAFEIVNSVADLLTLAFVVLIIPYASFRIHRLSPKSRLQSKRIGCLAAGVRMQNPGAKHRHVFTLFRRLILGVTVGLFGSQAVYSLVIGIILHVLSMVELQIFRPYLASQGPFPLYFDKNNLLLLFEALSVLLLLLLTSLALVSTDQSSTLQALSAAAIAVFIFNFVMGLAFLVWQLVNQFASVPSRFASFKNYLQDESAEFQAQGHRPEGFAMKEEQRMIQPAADIRGRRITGKQLSERPMARLQQLQFINYNEYESDESEEDDRVRAPEFLVKFKN